MNNQYVHPLSKIEIIDTVDGKKEVINSWGFASIIWSSSLCNNLNAKNIARELINNPDRFLSLYLRSKQGNKAAIKEAIAIIATGLDEKLEEVFENDTI